MGIQKVKNGDSLISMTRRFIADAATRGRINSIAQEIEDSLHTGKTSDTQDALSEILDFASKNVPFYRSFLGKGILDYPVVDKTIINSDLQRFLSDGLNRNKTASASTSGSTGTPFTAYFDSEKLLRRRAGVVANYNFINSNPYGSIVYAKSWKNLSIKQRLMMTAKGHFAFSGSKEDDAGVGEVAEWIKKHSPVTIMGYSSFVEDLLYSFQKKGIRLPEGAVAAVLGGSEPSTSYLGEASQQLFGTYPHMRYSNMEMGIIAVTDSDIEIYNIDTSSYYVEILEENSNNPVRPGASGRIVVSDLYNKAMPLLRYDTGDLGQFAVDANGNEIKSQITDLRGRRLDVIIGGTLEEPKRIHAMRVFLGSTSKIPQLRQFQLRQHQIGKFTWVLNAEKSETVERQLFEMLEEAVGAIKECNFVYTDEVPTAASGKRKFFVNEMSFPTGM